MIIPRFRIQEDCCSNVNSALQEKKSGPRSLLQWPRENYKAWAPVVAEGGVCFGWNRVLQKDMFEFQPLAPVHLTLFVNKIFAGMITFR